MKCKAFASQLEAHVGHSPVRGGNHEVGDHREQPIKTDRNIINNLNQLLSRVKTIFSRKATRATTTAPNAEPPTDLSVISDLRLSAAFADIEKYLAENYGTPTAKLSYQDYTNGASLFSKDTTFAFAPSLVILTDTDGLYNLPDNVMMLVSVTSIKDENWLVEELGKFILFLKELGMTCHIQHFAIGFSKDKFDHPATVQTADVTCLRLY